jgi:hypothetical protein
MGYMTPITGAELEAARRREVIRGQRDELGRGSTPAVERRTSRRDLAWLASAATIALGSRFARG